MPDYAQPPQAPEQKEAEVGLLETNSELPNPAAHAPASANNGEAPVPAGMAPAYGQASPQGYAPPPQGYAPPQQGPPAYAQAPTPPQAPAPAQAPPAPIIINIQQNASGFNWAPPPAPAAVSQANCPPGMEYFLGINSITVHQKVSCSENCSSLCCPCIAPCVHEGNEYTVRRSFTSIEKF